MHTPAYSNPMSAIKKHPKKSTNKYTKQLSVNPVSTVNPVSSSTISTVTPSVTPSTSMFLANVMKSQQGQQGQSGQQSQIKHISLSPSSAESKDKSFLQDMTKTTIISIDQSPPTAPVKVPANLEGASLLLADWTLYDNEAPTDINEVEIIPCVQEDPIHVDHTTEDSFSEVLDSMDEDNIHKLSVSVAESVTAGALSNTLCSIPGARNYFMGSMVLYSLQSKYDLLGIDIKYAELYNFANPLTTYEMAVAICKRFKSRIGIATTGYSLPYSREEDKSNGLCALDIRIPYVMVTLYDSQTNYNLTRRFDYDFEEVTPKLLRSRVQAKASLDAQKMYLEYCYRIQKKKS